MIPNTLDRLTLQELISYASFPHKNRLLPPRPPKAARLGKVLWWSAGTGFSFSIWQQILTFACDYTRAITSGVSTSGCLSHLRVSDRASSLWIGWDQKMTTGRFWGKRSYTMVVGQALESHLPPGQSAQASWASPLPCSPRTLRSTLYIKSVTAQLP